MAAVEQAQAGPNADDATGPFEAPRLSPSLIGPQCTSPSLALVVRLSRTSPKRGMGATSQPPPTGRGRSTAVTGPRGSIGQPALRFFLRPGARPQWGMGGAEWPPVCNGPRSGAAGEGVRRRARTRRATYGLSPRCHTAP